MQAKNGLALQLIFLFGFGLTAWSQSITGSIRGIVTDGENHPVAGATVTISSKALIGQTRVTNTTASGTFRFASLPIGLYTVQVQLQGFEVVRGEGIEVALHSTAYVPLVMKLSKQESVIVVADTPLIDPDNPGLSTIYKEEMLENLPSRRNMWFLMQVAPGITVDVGDALDDRAIAFGSNRQSSSWNIDGIDVTSPETGSAWWTTNPDIIEQIQIIGVGTPAEYGNHTGAVFNVITKKGSNNLHGAMNSFFQSDTLTGVNVRLSNSESVFHREKYYDITGQLGGPIISDKVWFFGGIQTSRDSSTTPGTDPEYPPFTKSNRYDLKISARISSNHDLNAFFHHEESDFAGSSSLYVAPSAVKLESVTNPAWGAIFTSTLRDNLLVEAKYAGWWSRDLRSSLTGSREDPYVDWTTTPETYSAGFIGPWDYSTYRHQINSTTTYYADRFLDSRHEFKFGAQYTYGSADTIYAYGPNGFYTYLAPWGLYDSYQRPYHYGGTSRNFGVFLDDTVNIGDRLTLNLGLRFDHNNGSIPDYDRLEVGTPSITPIGNFRRTGDVIPGVKNFVNWNLFSPRIGFVWQTRKDGKSAIRGSFGVYYDHNVIGNWETPPTDPPKTIWYFRDPITGTTQYCCEGSPADDPRNYDFDPPRALQYSTGYEYQTTQNSSIGIEYVYKDTTDLIGWNITGGAWEPFPFIDPFTGRQYTLLFMIEPPTLQKGNDPGDFPGSEGLSYYQKYHALILTFTKRFSDKWAVNASYTWSKSYGLVPRMVSQEQMAPFYKSNDGSNPNMFTNAEGRLQGDRPHMLRTQAVVTKLLWDLLAAVSIEFSSGRAHSRQIGVFVQPHGVRSVIMQPIGSYRHSPIQNIDVSIGKRIELGNQFQLSIDGQILNLLNSDQELSFATLRLAESEWFQPNSWVQPRRLQLRLGFQF